jgi:signal transduction histidine kinase
VGDGNGLAPSVVSAVGVVVVLATVAEWVVLATTGGLRPATVLVQVALNLVPGVALVYAGVGLLRRFEAERHARVAGWCLGALVVSLGANAVLMLAFPPDPAVFALGWTRTAAAFGAVTGVAVGVVEARAIERSLAAERARVRAEEAERQRERLAYLNSLLRHEVLNAANVVIGHASYVVEHEDVDAVNTERFAAVERQGKRLADVVSDVRLLTEAIDDDTDLEPVDLVAVVEREIDVLGDRHDAVRVETDLPPEAAVLADGLLGHVFEHLLDNAVEHNESGTPEVSAAVERFEDRVVVDVADDGPGIPPAERDAMFERETAHNHGLGLLLVRTLVERYDGTVELAETGPDGSQFTVELPRCSETGAGATSERGADERVEAGSPGEGPTRERDDAGRDGQQATS